VQFDFNIFNSVGLGASQGVENIEISGGNEDDASPFNTFQRFCVLLLELHGELERVAQN
jgi:hypothetical protein